ncbi:ATP-binding cassette domain-containing protein [Solicola sp. PLA-1-18]|uniref:ATP-binding cassette domain-containing protein n=1 Tax=Solicola sp. PLA-1-18 TaxID=3380532 RepID=UPI003B797512
MSHPASTLTGAPTVMRLSGITKRYGGVTALSQVDLDIRPGEVHAVLGENGAGKSTLMGVATGATQPDEGTIAVDGREVDSLTPRSVTDMGIAIVHQHPAVLPDLTVLENLRVALPSSVLPLGRSTEAARAIVDRVGLDIDLSDRVDTLTLAEKHLLEVAKAFALDPTLLILDEPTAPLGADAVDRLFELVRSAVRGGTAVVYITHRMAEVRQLAHRVTVLRDGEVRGTSTVDEITDEDLLGLIIGRRLESTFPPKLSSPADDATGGLRLTGLSGHGFEGVDAEVRRGEILGVAGVVGNGQTELLRALAGLDRFTGTVEVAGTGLTPATLRSDAAYVPADRQSEGLMMKMSVRENASLLALSFFRRSGLMSRRRELDAVHRQMDSLSVKTASAESPVSSLSGGNQQKVVLARALLSEPPLVVADEPTQGVDVGARAEIYTILRETSAAGVPVVIASSDAKELEGLCDRVIVMSRGHVVADLHGEEVTETRIIQAAVTSTTEVVADAERNRSSRLGRWLDSEYTPTLLLVAVMVLLAVLIAPGNDRYLSAFNISNLLLGATAVGFIALGQNFALLTGGIDLSVGPLAGFLVVVASFFVNDGSSPVRVVTGLVLMLLVAVGVGTVNGLLIRFGHFTPIAATLTLYIALGGFAFLLRPTQDGYISISFQTAINSTVGPLPVAFLALVALVVVLELGLRRRRWGLLLRGAGSDEDAARRVGIPVNRTVVLAYVAASTCCLFGALLLMGQYGIGDPSQGSAFTLTSVTAVVLGGTALTGGRGTFVGTLAGALLLQQLLNATTFLGLGSTSQYYFQGLLILVAAVVYTLLGLRRRRLAGV